MREAILRVVKEEDNLKELLKERSLLNRKIELAEERLRTVKSDLFEALPDTGIYLVADKNLVIEKDESGYVFIHSVINVS
jgi:hypothetical protein